MGHKVSRVLLRACVQTHLRISLTLLSLCFFPLSLPIFFLFFTVNRSIDFFVFPECLSSYVLDRQTTFVDPNLCNAASYRNLIAQNFEVTFRMTLAIAN